MKILFIFPKKQKRPIYISLSTEPIPIPTPVNVIKNSFTTPNLETIIQSTNPVDDISMVTIIVVPSILFLFILLLRNNND